MSEKELGYIPIGNESEFSHAMKAFSKNVDEYGGIVRSTGSAMVGRTFLDFDTNISIRSEYSRSDYEYFRGAETIPRKDIDIVKMCMMAYDKVPIVNSAINMMGDFTVQGIRIVHPNKKIENFYKNWAKEVDFEGVSERISNMLYRTANCPIKIRYADISQAVEQEFRKSHAVTVDMKIKQQKIKKRRIPFG